MRRLVGEHFRPDGRPKKAFAMEVARSQAAKQGKRFYLCSICKAWHVGKPPHRGVASRRS